MNLYAEWSTGENISSLGFPPSRKVSGPPLVRVSPAQGMRGFNWWESHHPEVVGLFRFWMAYSSTPCGSQFFYLRIFQSVKLAIACSAKSLPWFLSQCILELRFGSVCIVLRWFGKIRNSKRRIENVSIRAPRSNSRLTSWYFKPRFFVENIPLSKRLYHLQAAETSLLIGS